VSWGIIRYAAGTGCMPEEDRAAFDGWYTSRADAKAAFDAWRERHPYWIIGLVELHDGDGYFPDVAWPRDPHAAARGADNGIGIRIREMERMGGGRQAIISALEHADAPLGPAETAEMIDEKATNVRFLLHKMTKAGSVRRVGYGQYVAA
jgi:hypothetical protein